jgi:hypothetical protein
MQMDIDEIIKVKPSPWRLDVVLACEPTKNKIFTVKSAYWLALNDREWPSIGAMIREPNGHCAIWKAIWGCPAPQRYAISAWKLAKNALANWENKHKRNLEVSNICVLCTVECKDLFHVFYSVLLR